MYKGQEYGGSGGGGEMPSCYDNLTELLENEVLTADTTNNVLRGSFEGELKLGYIQDAYKIDENGDPIVWGDTEQTGLTGAIGSMCDRIAALEESGGGSGMPEIYDELTSIMNSEGIVFEDHPSVGNSNHTIDIAIGRTSASEQDPIGNIYPNISLDNGTIDVNYTSINFDRGTLTLETGYGIIDATRGKIINTNEWGNTGEEDLSAAIGTICNNMFNPTKDSGYWGDWTESEDYHYGTEKSELSEAMTNICQRIEALEEGGGGGGEMPAEYDGLTWLLDNEYIEFNTENVPYGIKLNNLAAIDLDHNGDIVKSGYWAGSTGGGISDSGSLVTFMEALCTVVNTTGEDLDNLENTVGGLSDTVDTLSNNFDSLNEELAGFTSGYITFEDSNNMTFNDIALHLDDSDIVNESGYWGAWEDEQTQESSNGTQTNNLAEALSNICRRLEAIEAVLQNQ